MNLEDDQQLKNAQRKLSQVETQLTIARGRPASDANLASIRSLVQMANQLQEEIVRYHARQERRAS